MRFLSLLLKPLSFVYGLILKIRHRLFDRGFFKSYSFDIPIIVIGNLSLGGSGKTPLAIYIAKYLEQSISVYNISRGYRRKTKGFLETNINESYENYGDEPFLIKSKLKHSKCFVSEDRILAIQHIIKQNVEKKVILLDDAFQHRRLNAGFNILLTDYSLIFPLDDLVPHGKLRDLKERSSVVDLIMITKSPTQFSIEEKLKKVELIQRYTKAPIIFSSLRYLSPENYLTKELVDINEKIVVVSAIANSNSFIEYLKVQTTILKHFKYIDHRTFSKNDVIQWIEYAKKFTINQIVTTEKDAVRLTPYLNLFIEFNIHLIIIPIEMEFDRESNLILTNMLNRYIASYD